MTIVGFNLSDWNTGELFAQNVNEYELTQDYDIKRLHAVLDSFVRGCKLRPNDTLCLEFKQYREHKQLELPF